MRDAIGTHISLGSIVAYTGQDMHVYVAIVQRLADNEYVAIERLDLPKSMGYFHARGDRMLVIHPLHYTDEMRSAVVEWEDAHPEIVLSNKPNEAATYVYTGPPLKVQMGSIEAKDLVSNGRLNANKITVGRIPCRALHQLADDGGPAHD